MKSKNLSLRPFTDETYLSAFREYLVCTFNKEWAIAQCLNGKLMRGQVEIQKQDVEWIRRLD